MERKLYVRHSPKPIPALWSAMSTLVDRPRLILVLRRILLAYLFVVVGVVLWLGANPESQWRILVAVLPLIPLSGGAWIAVKLFVRSDERDQRIQVEAMAFAFIVTAPLVLTYGMLEMVGFPRLSAWWFWFVLALAWAVGRILTRGRHS